MKIHRLNIPLINYNILKNIENDDFVYVSGKVYIMRDRAHKRYIKENKHIIDFNGSAIYYAGPTQNGITGPTTSSRMDKYTEYFADKGVKIFIGKGERDNFLLKKIYLKNNSLYLTTFGGIASYLTKKTKNLKLVCYEDLGCEAIYEVDLKNFPCICSKHT
ncbi:MAG: fumarate hydratase C-terminal domain-containing protein [Candidatus Muirbacterium halophilum]|nr:fumarate hydratase C-terminal domain-containing protein [Candidatus Muirbacterium halophilum]MCK9475474.1 fumarate hydratase C-terminal domain-containing protein [Candidatus Muirbacterium halophilum]